MKCKALERAKKHFERKDDGRFNPRSGEKLLERDVKKFVKEIILELCPAADIFMPVQTGYGAVDLDFIVGINGYYLAIETKANGKKPTSRQMQTIQRKIEARIPVLVIDQNNLEGVAAVVESLANNYPMAALTQALYIRSQYVTR